MAYRFAIGWLMLITAPTTLAPAATATTLTAAVNTSATAVKVAAVTAANRVGIVYNGRYWIAVDDSRYLA